PIGLVSQSITRVFSYLLDVVPRPDPSDMHRRIDLAITMCSDQFIVPGDSASASLNSPDRPNFSTRCHRKVLPNGLLIMDANQTGLGCKLKFSRALARWTTMIRVHDASQSSTKQY